MGDGRRVIAQQWISADGMVAGAVDEQEIFATIPDSSDSERHNRRLLEDVDVVLLGRRTYETFARFWPTSDEPMAHLVNTVPEVVATTTLAAAPWGDHQPARVVPDAVGFVRAERGRPGRTLLVWGSLVLMRSLLRAGQLDELELLVSPLLQGTGQPLLAGEGPYRLRQVDGEVWSSGTTRLRYEVQAG